MASAYPREPRSAPRPGVAFLAAVFAQNANITFGGGTATAETLRRELVERRNWIPHSDFRLAFTVSRLTPATNLLALCTAIGWLVRGLPGAVAALLASSIPSALITAIVMAGYQQAVQHEIAADALRGAVAVAVALLLSSVLALVRPQIVSGKRVRAATVILASWAAHEIVGVSALVVLASAAVLGALWTEDSQA